MKQSIVSLLLVFSLGLTGCSALLNREYGVATVHSITPAAAEGDPSVLRAESYQELVNILLYLITQGEESRRVRLYGYSQGQVEMDISSACAEVLGEDPLGGYSVEKIEYSVSTIVSYFEVDFDIFYRRSRTQVDGILPVTGERALRSTLQQAFSTFERELVLRASYFSGDEEDIRALVTRTYYDTPAAALEMPDFEVYLYPVEGERRIIEIVFSYILPTNLLNARKQAVEQKAEQLCANLWAQAGDELLDSLCLLLQETVVLDKTAANTAYAALVGGTSNSEGMALALAVLCEEVELSCQVVQGTRNGIPHSWNVISTQAGYRHIDLAAELFAQTSDAENEEEPEIPEIEGIKRSSDREMAETGYLWDTALTPQCGEQPVEVIPAITAALENIEVLEIYT